MGVAQPVAVQTKEPGGQTSTTTSAAAVVRKLWMEVRLGKRAELVTVAGPLPRCLRVCAVDTWLDTFSSDATIEERWESESASGQGRSFGILAQSSLVEEFHSLLVSLSVANQSESEFVSLCAAVLSAQTRDRHPSRSAIRGVQELARTLGSFSEFESKETKISSAQPLPKFSPAALALAPPKLVEQCLQGVNYFKTKARRLQELAAYLLRDHRGAVPRSFEGLTALPGVGPKIANLVLSVTFNHSQAGMVVDTHVHRVAGRLGWSQGKTPEATRKDLEELVAPEMRELVTRRLIGFGQEICRPQHPRCSQCPVGLARICPTQTAPEVFRDLRPGGTKRTYVEIDLDD
ncbi:unnamed protein product [Effrenium voratum]|nr:unnamed protein product [Effrenium voratum]